MLYKSLVIKISIPPEKKTKQKEYLEIGLLPIVDQGKEIIGGYTNEVEKNIVCNLPVIVFGDHTCSVKYINFPFGAGADGIKILKAKDNVLPQYLFYGTQYLVFHLHDRGYARHYQHIEKMDLYVPPIEEQRRIVSRIEELFSELDSAVETLQKTRQQLEIYRQAVLKEAFQECTVSVKIEDVCIHVTDGDHMPPPKSETGIPFIMISNIQNNKINWNNTAFVDSNYFDKIIDKRRPQQGDVLYTVTGSFGIPVLIDFDKKFCFQRHIALLRPNEKINQKYLYYVMQNPIVYEQARNKATGTAQKTVGLSVLRKIEIPFVDSLVEQEKIVLNIENKMSVCDSIEKTVNECLQQAEAMRQSIFKKAFEGEL